MHSLHTDHPIFASHSAIRASPTFTQSTISKEKRLWTGKVNIYIIRKKKHLEIFKSPIPVQKKKKEEIRKKGKRNWRNPGGARHPREGIAKGAHFAGDNRSGACSLFVVVHVALTFFSPLPPISIAADASLYSAVIVTPCRSSVSQPATYSVE